MKISESVVQLSAHHAFEEADLLEQEETRETVTGRVSLGNNRPTGGIDANGIPTMLVDRVSISHRAVQEVQSEYTASLESRSTVTSAEATTQFHQQELVERLVGAVMDREVVARTLRDGDDIRSGNDIAAGPEPVRAFQAQSTESLVTMNKTQVHFEQEQMGFSSQGQVRTEDGRLIDFSLDMAMDRAYLSRTQEETMIHTWQQEVSLIDPLVISLDGGLPQLTDTRFEFDLDNDGTTEEISFVAKGSGFLSFDKNNDGVINNGSELFGPGTGNGFEELAAFDGDGNGWIDENDEVFSQLTVWTRDDKGNDQLVSLKDAGVGAIYLDNAQAEFNYTTMDNELQGQLRRSGVFLFENGNVGGIQQIDLAARVPVEETVEGEPAIPEPFDAQALFAPAINLAVSPEEEVAENPLKMLMDQIKALREEIQQILGNRTGRGKGGSRLKSSALTFSDYQLYKMTRPDPGMLKLRSWQA
jgi:hypothetical protein